MGKSAVLKRAKVCGSFFMKRFFVNSHSRIACNRILGKFLSPTTWLKIEVSYKVCSHRCLIRHDLNRNIRGAREALPLEDIQNKVEKDLWEGGVLKSIGCPGMMVPEENGKYHYFGKTEDGTEKNGLYRWRFRANFRSGQWELELYTTRGLRVPEERMPGGKSGGCKEAGTGTERLLRKSSF